LGSTRTGSDADLCPVDCILDKVIPEETPSGFAEKLAEIAEAYAPVVKVELLATIEAPKSVEEVADDVTKVLYENEMAQAKTIFRALREQILAMSSDAGTGSLDKQYEVMQAETNSQLELLGAIDDLQVLITAASIMLGVYPGGDVAPERRDVWDYNGGCQIVPEASTTDCQIYRDEVVLGFSLQKTGRRVDWNVNSAAPYYATQSTPLNGFTGSIAFTISTASLLGSYVPLAEGAAKTPVDVDATTSGDQETVKNYKLQGTGVLNSVDAQGASLFKTEISSFTFDTGGVAGRIVSPVLDVTLVASSPSFRFTGRLKASSVLESQAPGQDWIDYEPATAKLSGKFENTGEQFPLFDGLFTLSQDWSNGYKPFEDESASNFRKLRGSFVGTLFEAKGKAGLTLNLQATRDEWLEEALSFDFATGNGVALQGTAAGTAGLPADPEWVWSLATSNGVKLSDSEFSKSGEVRAADGGQLGTIGRDRVSFADGTRSLLS